MTHEQIEQHRKRFEELFAKIGSGHALTVDHFGRYASNMAHFMWHGYLLCAENITVREIAESQGIKVKP